MYASKMALIASGEFKILGSSAGHLRVICGSSGGHVRVMWGTYCRPAQREYFPLSEFRLAGSRILGPYTFGEFGGKSRTEAK